MDDRWAEFFDRYVLPILSTLALIASVALVLIIAARLLVFLPIWKALVVTVGLSSKATWGGLVSVVAVACAAVLLPASIGAEASLWPVIIIAGLAVPAVVVLAIGLATSPRLDATVVDDDGAANSAWVIDVLEQMKDAHRESTSTRVFSANTPDFGDLILVADRSGNGLAALFASIWQLLFNTSPWQLQVTILDKMTAAAKLRRNGHGVEDELLELEFGDGAQDNHRKLLTMAAAFATISVSRRYPDITGYYRVTSWRSAAFTALANATSGDERTHYITRALAEDPSNLVAEYAEVLDAFHDENDDTMLSMRMNRLEQMIDKAAKLSAYQPVLNVEPAPWHRVTEEIEWPEPPLMMLRLMRFYLGSARNLIAVKEQQGDPDGDAELELRRHRIGAVLAAYIDCLAEWRPSPRWWKKTRGEDPRETELHRFRMIAAIDDTLLRSWVEVRHSWPVEYAVETWFGESLESLDAEVEYHHACWLAHLIRSESMAAAGRPADLLGLRKNPRLARLFDGAPVDLLEALVDAVGYAHFVPWFRDWTFSDPELRLLGGEAAVRELALAEIDDAWRLERFAAAADRPIEQMPDPSLLTDSDLKTLRSTITRREFEWIADGAHILRAIRDGAPPEFREVDILRIAKHLLDDEKHDVRTLRACAQHRPDRLANGIAAAVYWVPSEAERASAEAFVMALRECVREPAPGRLDLARAHPMSERAGFR